MASLLEYRDNLVKYNACARYMRPLQYAMERGDKYEMVKLATDINGADVTCDSFAFGWGLDEERYKREYKDFINEAKILSHNGYCSMLYVGHTCSIRPICALNIFLACNCEVKVDSGITAIIFAANSNVKVTGKGNVELHLYGECTKDIDPNITIDSVEEYKTSKWINNGNKE